MSLRANLNPCTRVPFIPVNNTEDNPNEERKESVPIQNVKKKNDDHKYSGDKKVSVHHYAWQYEGASM